MASSPKVRKLETGIPGFDVISYGGQTSDDWQNKQTALDRERARVAGRARDSVRDTTAAGVPAPDSATANSGH